MYRAIAIIAAVILCLLLMYLALGRLPLRVRLGRNTRCVRILLDSAQRRLIQRLTVGKQGINGSI